VQVSKVVPVSWLPPQQPHGQDVHSMGVGSAFKCHLAAQQFAFIISRLFLVVLLFDRLNPSIGLVVFAFN